eukprot:CAMPEP_0203676464 /NCGR_PEP_ID=MMETSP0090-20130426/24614_1 /ASSEMBLY_ACC=CAM_ASM_001088 /TAXON_ID=426623 /ORGANISM="Chaetoceros affinis, Strain CCMP159" /LENGTH=83 /DNA_ID=CAMNT_0050543015 /DNA_START=40 /DNA_END=288 /DNA_ORIENTATION=+
MNLGKALSLLLTTSTVSSVAGFSVRLHHATAPTSSTFSGSSSKRSPFLAKGGIIGQDVSSSRLSPLKMSETVEKKDEETFEFQ